MKKAFVAMAAMMIMVSPQAEAVKRKYLISYPSYPIDTVIQEPVRTEIAPERIIAHYMARVAHIALVYRTENPTVHSKLCDELLRPEDDIDFPEIGRVQTDINKHNACTVYLYPTDPFSIPTVELKDVEPALVARIQRENGNITVANDAIHDRPYARYYGWAWAVDPLRPSVIKRVGDEPIANDMAVYAAKVAQEAHIRQSKDKKLADTVRSCTDFVEPTALERASIKGMKCVVAFSDQAAFLAQKAAPLVAYADVRADLYPLIQSAAGNVVMIQNDAVIFDFMKKR